ncbi:MAG: sodium:proton antiporter [Chloroflexi bacterium 13_1_40CM_2_68_14]|nr:MAG: sodium:proton antiporter [Chloroflexi bacterium 13_1_40CM_2_68_14]
MPHETALIATIAGGIGLAFVLGFAATRVRLPPLVGYLLAGIAVGPFTPGFVADTGLAQQLAEIGVILLMFGVGIHFSVADLLAVRRIAVPGALVQITVATAFGAAAAHLWGWSWGSGIVFGLCLSVASTVVLLRALEDRRMVDSADGRIAVGWLIVEDLATVLVLVLLPALAVPLGGIPRDSVAASAAGTASLLVAIGVTLAKVAAFVVLMLVVGRRVVPWLLLRVARTGSRELFTLSVLAVALGVAVGAAGLFGVSVALGAFFAGMVVNGSDLSHEAATEALPLQDAFSVLFFVAVGMLFDPAILLRQPLQVLTVVLIVMIGKSLGAFFIVLLFRYPVRTALTISASLAQIGEFSFILAALAVALHLLPPEGQGLIVAGALLSISLNPVAFWAASRANRWIGARPHLLAWLARPAGAAAEPRATVDEHTLRGHVIIVGFGRVGTAIIETFAQQRIPYVVVEQNRETLEAARSQGLPVLHGDATRPEVLRQAGIDHARLLVVATPDPFQTRAIVELARSANPAIDTVARAHSEAERIYLERHGVRLVLIGEHELALGLAHHVLLSMGCGEDEADATIDASRRRMRQRDSGNSLPPTDPIST